MPHYEYYVYPVLPGADARREHTADHPFCGDERCPCASDEGNQQTLNHWYQEGLIGPVDGDLIVQGRTLI